MSLKLANPQHAALHKQAISLKPNEDLPGNKYWVGIIGHNDHEPLNEHTQLLWVKAKPVSLTSSILR
jgi:hypothetical protein